MSDMQELKQELDELEDSLMDLRLLVVLLEAQCEQDES